MLFNFTAQLILELNGISAVLRAFVAGIEGGSELGWIKNILYTGH
jgi:hypothetical protein